MPISHFPNDLPRCGERALNLLAASGVLDSAACAGLGQEGT